MQQKVLNNRYELEQKIGEGGMARVYRGRDLRLNRRVAVKVLHSHHAADANFISRFHHEAQAAANLHHPNIVDVYDVGQDRDIHYIVMEYIAGSDLKTRLLQRGALPLEEAIVVGRAVAEGLEAAHRMGMIHRDIKPQNIILGEDGQVKITDFGIAKSALSTATTETGITFGTADYISPEQARGQTATPRSDIYSLGVTLYEALTGRLPFTGDSSIAVAMQHVNEDPPPLRMLNMRIPPQIEAIVLSMLSKNPDQRPANARDVARMLAGQRVLSEQETLVRQVQPRQGVPAPQPRQPQSAAQIPRPSLPPMRSSVPVPASTSAGLGIGSFLIGVLLLGVVLAVVYLFATGALDGVFNAVAGSPSRPNGGIIGNGSRATPTVGASDEATATPLTTPAPEIQMPSLLGLEARQARETLFDLGVTAQEDAPRASEVISPGLVLDQFPPPGQLIDATTLVTFAVSLGPETAEVPNVVGLRVINARVTLEQLGFRVQIVEENSTTVSEGFVIRTDPVAGVLPPRGETITVVYSTGNKTTMPDVTNLPIEEARRQIAAAGLFISFEDNQSCDRLPAEICASTSPGQVVSSVPRGGERVERGTGVTLGVRAP
jgi:eukaryotic-like serine/threonine-protein kinase